MDDLVQGPLHEGRIDGDHRAHSLHGLSCGKGDRMLFGNADIKKTVREIPC